jgi:ribosomal protein S18 acetylase RimI-like enzyme
VIVAEWALSSATDLTLDATARDEVLVWIHGAGNPYFDWLFGDFETAHSIIQKWTSRDSSEVAWSRVQLMSGASGTVGGWVAMNGAELTAARKADTLAIMRDCSGALRQAVAGRLRLAAGLFAAPPPNSLYLSKFGISADSRGQGLGSRLLEALLNSARARGYERLCLDVSSDNQPALRIYERAGFYLDNRATTADGALTYLSMSCILKQRI